MWPAPSPAPLLCWRTTNLQKETDGEEWVTTRQRKEHISAANNHRCLEDCSCHQPHEEISPHNGNNTSRSLVSLNVAVCDWGWHNVSITAVSACEWTTRLHTYYVELACLDKDIWSRSMADECFTHLESFHHHKSRHWQKRKIAKWKMWEPEAKRGSILAAE